MTLAPLAAAFAVFGAFWGTWAVIATDVRHDLDVSYGTFGLLLSISLGAAAVGNLLAGGLTERWGAAKTMTRALGAWAALVGAFALGGGDVPTAALFVLLVAVGGGVDVVINVASAAALEGRPGRLVQFHGFFNGGAALGAAVAGIVLSAGASWRVVVGAVAAAGLVVAMYSRGARLPASEAGESSLAGAWHALRRDRLLGLALLFATAALVEGGIETWGVLFLRDELDASVAVGAAGAVVAFATVTAARVLLGPVAGGRGVAGGVFAGALLAATGTAWLVMARPAPLAAFGLVAAAAGASMCWPLLIAAAAAGRQRPATAIGAVTSVGYLGFVVGPTVVGWIAGGFGLRAGITALTVAAACVAVGATRLRLPAPDTR